MANYNDPRYPNNNERTSGRNVSGYEHSNETANDNNANAAAASTAPETNSQTPAGVTMITPNVSKWNKMKTMAQKEEEDFQRYKEANRPTSVYEPPERIGGHASLEEARQRQVAEQRQSKLQKKLKREEQDRRRRQEEEEELEKKKAKAREQAERLEERKRQEEARRRDELQEDHLRSREKFLQEFERKGPAPVASSSATHASSWGVGKSGFYEAGKKKKKKGTEPGPPRGRIPLQLSAGQGPGTQQYANLRARGSRRAQDQREAQREEENSTLQLKKEEQRKKSEALEQKQSKNNEEIQLDHRRVNSAWLDGLTGQNRESGTSQMEEWREAGRSSLSFEDISAQRAHSPEPQEDPPACPDADPRQRSNNWDTEADPEPDFDWALMRLESRLSWWDRGFLKDILTQCNGDYHQAYTLLSEMQL